MEYNAVIREYTDKSLKVVNRVLITDLNDVPQDWTVKYGSTPRSQPASAGDVEDLCCGPMNPLQIYKPEEISFNVVVRSVFGKSVVIPTTKDCTVKVLKWKIFQKIGTHHPTQQELCVNRNDQEVKMKDSRRLAEYGIGEEVSSVFLKGKPATIMDLPYKAVDMDARYPRRNILGDATPLWGRYSAGLNLCGICPNRKCISRRLDIDVVIPMGYGATGVTLSGNQFPCPACKEFLISPDKFLVASARALFKYKRANEEKVRISLVESVGSGEQYEEIFLGLPYLLEITTVEPWRSPYSCVKCDVHILFKSQEYLMPCGHMYHKLCKPRSIFKKCRVCEGKLGWKHLCSESLFPSC